MFWIQISLLLTALVVRTHCLRNVTYDIKLMPEYCLEERAISGNYAPLGEMINIGNLPVYEAPANKDKKRMLINAYDIFGLSTNMKQITDQIALESGGFRSILPDFFRGEGWQTAPSESNLTELSAWVQRVGDWDTVTKPDLINILRHYRNEGVEEFALFGICWGAKIAVLSAIDLSNDFKATALVQPSSISNDEAVDVKIPMFLMPANNDIDMLPFYQVLISKFGDNCGHRRFEDVSHGFASSTGNFSDLLIQERVNEVIATFATFFNRNLNETNGNNSINIQPGQLLIITLIALIFVIFSN